MPRGVYKRKKRAQRKPAEPSTHNGNSAAMSQGVAIEGFKDQAKAWHRSSIAVVASAAVCMIVGAYSPTAKVAYDNTEALLKKEVAEIGIKQAQIYKYIGLARALVSFMVLKHKIGGPLLDVLRARDHDTAMDALVDYLTKARVRSLDSLGVMVGKYKRTVPLPEEEAPKTQAEQTEEVPKAVTPTRATAQAIAARLIEEPNVLNALPAKDFVTSFIQAGHRPSELIEALIPHIDTVKECSTLIDKLDKKLRMLKKGIKLVTSGGKRMAVG